LENWTNNHSNERTDQYQKENLQLHAETNNYSLEVTTQFVIKNPGISTICHGKSRKVDNSSSERLRVNRTPDLNIDILEIWRTFLVIKIGTKRTPKYKKQGVGTVGSLQ
jgi:hypothetical protein